MGIVPLQAKIGDHLCVIAGFEMPMLLREDTGRTGEGGVSTNPSLLYIHGGGWDVDGIVGGIMGLIGWFTAAASDRAPKYSSSQIGPGPRIAV